MFRLLLLLLLLLSALRLVWLSLGLDFLSHTRKPILLFVTPIVFSPLEVRARPWGLLVALVVSSYTRTTSGIP